MGFFHVWQAKDTHSECTITSASFGALSIAPSSHQKIPLPASPVREYSFCCFSIQCGPLGHWCTGFSFFWTTCSSPPIKHNPSKNLFSFSATCAAAPPSSIACFHAIQKPSPVSPPGISISPPPLHKRRSRNWWRASIISSAAIYTAPSLPSTAPLSER